MQDDIIKKHSLGREGVLYIIFGVLTTAVDWVVYTALVLMGVNYMPATVVSWIAAVLFSFFTNKILVFESKDLSPRVILREMTGFVAARVSTLLLNILGMWVGVSIFKINDFIVKAVMSVLVVLINYILSKLFIFKKRDTVEK